MAPRTLGCNDGIGNFKGHFETLPQNGLPPVFTRRLNTYPYTLTVFQTPSFRTIIPYVHSVSVVVYDKEDPGPSLLRFCF